MTTAATTVTEDDIMQLRHLMLELHSAGRIAEAESLARIHADICALFYADWFEGDEENEELARMIAESDAELEAGGGIPHEEVMRRWREAGLA